MNTQEECNNEAVECVGEGDFKVFSRRAGRNQRSKIYRGKFPLKLAAPFG